MFLYKYRHHPFEPRFLRGSEQKTYMFRAALQHLQHDELNLEAVNNIFDFYRVNHTTGIEQIVVGTDAHMMKILREAPSYRTRGYYGWNQVVRDPFLDLPLHE